MMEGTKVRFRNSLEIEGIKSIPRRTPILEEEQHHSFHVLTFLYIAIHKTRLGERIGRRIVGRMIHHLMDVREFISDRSLTELLNHLRLSLEVEYDRSLCLFVRTFHKLIPSAHSFLIACSENEKVPSISLYPWIVAHWDDIHALARHYGRDDLLNKFIPIFKVGPFQSAGKDKEETWSI